MKSGIAEFILGILGLAGIWILGIPAIVLGAKHRNRDHPNLSLAGFIMGILSVIGGVVATVLIIFSIVVLSPPTAAPLEKPPEMPAETSQEASSTPIEVAEFDGLTVSLMQYHWDGNKLYTTWLFFNDRTQKNRAISLFAYDQDRNKITSDWPIMSGPILWPGEIKDMTMSWKCGPRSTEITITVREAAKWESGKKTIPTTDRNFTFTR